MQIYEVTDPLFKEYGKIIDSVELTELLAEMKHTPVPEDVRAEAGSACGHERADGQNLWRASDPDRLLQRS